MLNHVIIIPTGDEIRSGTVLDTDSPMIMQELLQYNSCCTVTRIPPIRDSAEDIRDALLKCVKQPADAVILIGGSGEGHRYSPVLGRDCTHLALEDVLDSKVSTALYGKNGHMWSKLVCGFSGTALVMNVPGPFREAQAAVHAMLSFAAANTAVTLEDLNRVMADAVRKQYG